LGTLAISVITKDGPVFNQIQGATTAVEQTHELRPMLQETMNFLGAIACGLEEALGEPANTVSHLAGEKLGCQFSQGHHCDDVLQALTEVQQVLQASGCLWNYEPFKPKNRENMVEHTENGSEVTLVFRDCMIRQALFCFGHHQKGSLCNLMNGFFASALQNITGREAKLEIVHAGENACMKKLTIRDQMPAQKGIPISAETRAPEVQHGN
jgi:predicted hydrocarbon binding protein